MQKIFEILIKQLTDFFRIEHVAIFQFGPSGFELTHTYSTGFGKESIQSYKNLKADQGVFKRLVNTRIPQIVNDIPETEIPPLAGSAKAEGLDSMIAVPVFSKEKLWGILTAFSREKLRFKEEDAKIISLFGGQIGDLLEHFSQHIQANLDELLVQILGSIELLNFRYKDRKSIPTSEILRAQERLKIRVLSFVSKLQQETSGHVITEEKRENEEIKLPTGGELSVEEVITIQGEKDKPQKAKKVLVIDDQPIVTDLLVSVLEGMNYKSEVASCGRDGVEMFEKEEADLVITDLGMPDISGWEVSRTIKQKKPDVPVILITGWGVDPDPDKVKDSKVDFVVNKPFQIDQLEKIIQDLLQK